MSTNQFRVVCAGLAFLAYVVYEEWTKKGSTGATSGSSTTTVNGVTVTAGPVILNPL